MAKQKLYLNYSLKDLENILMENGWVKERNNKHVIYKHRDRIETITLSHKHSKDISKGVVRKVLNTIFNNFYGQNVRHFNAISNN